MSRPARKNNKKTRIEPEPDDEFMKMDYQALQNGIVTQKEQYLDLKTRRNYYQMDRDMVEKFYFNIRQEIKEVKTAILNKESSMQQLEENHQVEVKVYLQKVKHLEYEQEIKNQEIQKDGDQAYTEENQYFNKRVKEMLDSKKEIKKTLAVTERNNQTNIDNENKKQSKLFENNQLNFDEKINQLIQKYENQLVKLKEELDLKLKVELHELEERKNLHINELINNHQKSFEDLKKYYNEITAENLALIKAQKEQLAKTQQNLNINTKIVADMKGENDALRDPLRKKIEERDSLRNLLRQFPKHKMSLSNLKQKLIVLKDKIQKLKNDRQDLDQKYELVIKEKIRLEEKFEIIVAEVKKHSELQNIILGERLNTMEDKLLQKNLQLEQLIQQSDLSPQQIHDIQNEIKDTIESKTAMINSLKYSIHHATKAYNDAIRVYEAKLVEFGIPPEELGFQILETKTSTMPAGLVSS